jgi:RNA polymerase sigma-70 factor (ECF subfamily)
MFFSTVREGTRVIADRNRQFEGLIRETNRQAFAFAYRLTGNSAEAEDLVQEAYVRAYRFFDKYDDRMPFLSWLYRIISNTHIDLIRRRGRVRTTSLENTGLDGNATWEFATEEHTAEQSMLNAAMDAPLQDALNAMNTEFRTAVLLADVEALAYEEVAEVMNTSVGTVRSRIHRGRKQLRDFLMKHAPERFARYADEL